MLPSMVKLVSVNVMDCVSVVLSNSFVKSQFCTVFLFLCRIWDLHSQIFLSAPSPRLCSSFLLFYHYLPFFLPSVQACRERIKGLQSEITAFSQRMNLINQRGTPDAEEMTI